MKSGAGAAAFGALVSLAALGCYADPPAPVDPSMLPACSAGSYGVLGTDPCERDEDCATCVTPSGTSRAVARSTLSAIGAECEGSTRSDAACCEHRCTLVASGALF